MYNNTNKMNSLKQITIFIGSPSDTAKERALVDDALEEINQTLGLPNNLLFKSFKWEHDVLPAIGSDPQNVINVQSTGYDYFVGIMWKKYGYPTPRADSATVEEYEIAYSSYKNNGSCKGIAIFFNNENIPILDLNDDLYAQISKVKEFKKRLSDDGVFYKEYAGQNDFLKLFRITMHQTFRDLFCKRRIDKKEHPRELTKEATNFDKNSQILFDSLLMNANVSKFKTSFVESCIYLYLKDVKQATAAQICAHLNGLLRKEDNILYNNVIGKLNQIGTICSTSSRPKQFMLSEEQEAQIIKIQKESEENEHKLALQCNYLCEKYELELDINILRDYVLKLFDKNYEIDTRELSNGILNRDNSIKRIYSELITYIKNESGLPEIYVKDFAEEVLNVFSNNPTLYKCSTSRMFLSLFQLDKLEEYMSITKRHLLFDTQVLLRFVCAIYDSEVSPYSDPIFLTCKNLWHSLRDDGNFIKHTTSGYVKEVADHLVQARDLSRFLSLEFIQDLGPSKNIFFNHYLSIKDELETSTFEEYVADLLDIDEVDVSSSSFASIANDSISNILRELGFHIESIPIIDKYDEYKTEYERVLAYNNISSKSYSARTNDIHAIIFLSGLISSFDNTPYLITMDTSFFSAREAFRKKFNHIGTWYIYSPQKIANTISVMNFQVNPTLINDNIVALAEANFNISNESISFIDLLSSFFINGKRINEWKLASKLSNLRKSLLETSGDFIKMKFQNIPVDEYLLLLCEYYNSVDSEYPFSEFQSLMSDNTYADDLARLFSTELEHFKGVDGKIEKSISNKFNALISKRLATSW